MHSVPVQVLSLTLPPMTWQGPVEIEMLLDLFDPKYVLVQGARLRATTSSEWAKAVNLFSIAANNSEPPHWNRLSAIVLKNAVLDPETMQAISHVVPGWSRQRRSVVRFLHDMAGVSDSAVVASVLHLINFARNLEDPFSQWDTKELNIELRLWVVSSPLRQKLADFFEGQMQLEKKWFQVDDRSTRVASLLREAWKCPRRGLDWKALEEM